MIGDQQWRALHTTELVLLRKRLNERVWIRLFRRPCAEWSFVLMTSSVLQFAGDASVQALTSCLAELGRLHAERDHASIGHHVPRIHKLHTENLTPHAMQHWTGSSSGGKVSPSFCLMGCSCLGFVILAGAGLGCRDDGSRNGPAAFHAVRTRDC